MSSLFWAVFDEKQKKKSEEILATFDKDLKDEMGLMNITISLSSLMFPGTSVLHTRLRYIFLVGWIFLEALKSKKEFTLELLHNKEKELRKILQEKQKEDKKAYVGILGSTKMIDSDGYGADLSQPPFSVYFNLLKEWNIILSKDIGITDISVESFCPAYREIIEDKKFKNDTFKLTKSEKQYIIKKIPPSILHTIFEKNLKLKKVPFIMYDISKIENVEQKNIFKYSQNFSILMWGTMLYYDYYLGNDSDKLKKRYKIWKDSVRKVVKSSWKPSDTFRFVDDKVSLSQEKFIYDWYEYVKKNLKNLDLDNPPKINKISVESFLKNREQQQKGNRARLLKKELGETFKEANFGINPIEYRWSNIVRFKKDFDVTS